MHRETVHRIDLPNVAGIPTSLQYLFGFEEDISQLCGYEDSPLPPETIIEILNHFNGEGEESPVTLATNYIETRELQIGDCVVTVNAKIYCKFKNLNYNIAYLAVPTEEVIYRAIYASFTDVEMVLDGNALKPVATHTFLHNTDGLYYNKLGYTDRMFDFLGYLRDVREPEVPNIRPLLHMILFDKVEGDETNEQ